MGQIVKEKVFFPYIDTNGKYIIFLTDKGTKFAKINLVDQTKQTLIDQEILGAQEIYYSPSGEKAIVISDYPEKNITLYNFSDKTSQKLNNKINKIQWSNDENFIYYSFFDKSTKEWQLNKANYDGANWQTIHKTKIQSLGDNIPGFSISPDNKKAIIYSYTDRQSSSNNFIIELETQKANQIDSKYQFKNVMWSPDNKKIAYLDKNDKLNIIDENMQINNNTEIKTTNYKISWMNNDNIILAIPKIFGELNGLYEDDICILNTNNNQLNLINANDSQSIEDITYINYLNNTIYYISKFYLYGLKIAQ